MKALQPIVRCITGSSQEDKRSRALRLRSWEYLSSHDILVGTGFLDKETDQGHLYYLQGYSILDSLSVATLRGLALGRGLGRPGGKKDFAGFEY